MNDRSCTVKDVAKLAGVSTATVSRVVTDAGNVSSETRTKVLTAIAKLRYFPNAHAAALGRANSGIPKRPGKSFRAMARHESKADLWSLTQTGTRKLS